MRRWLPAVWLFVWPAFAQEKAKPPQPAAQQEQEPPEEDEAAKPKEYSFNPLQAAKEVRVGNYYFKKGAFRAAVQRFREATKWNPGLAEAWLRLGEAAEKQRDHKTAKDAFAHYLELSPEAKNAPEIRKKIGK